MARIKIQKTLIDGMGNPVIRTRQCSAADVAYFEAEGFKKADMNANEKAVEKARAEAEVIELKAEKEQKELTAKIAELNRKKLGGRMGVKANHTPVLVAAPTPAPATAEAKRQ